MAITSIVFNPLDGSIALAADAGQGTATSTADSKAVVALAGASTADSKGVSAGTVGSTADSKATSAGTVGSTADSKATSAGTIASTAKAAADSAIGSEPTTGEYIVTDIKRNATGSIVIDYNDSAIGS